MPHLRWAMALLSVVAFFSIPAASAGQVDTVRVGIMVDQAPASLTTLFQQMRAEVLAVVGATAEIQMDESDVRPNGYDADRAELIYQSMIEGDVDVVLAFGPVSASVVSGRERYEKPTVLFGGVNRDLLELPAEGATSGISNFTYMISPESHERDLTTLRVLHDFSRLAIVIPSQMAQGYDLDERIQPLMDRLGVDYEIVAFDGINSLHSILDRFDAVYLLESIFIPDEDVATLAQLLIERQIPSFAAARREDVELGLLATNQPRDGLESIFSPDRPHGGVGGERRRSGRPPGLLRG